MKRAGDTSAVSAFEKTNNVEGLTTMAERSNRPGRIKSTQARDAAIRRTEIGRSFSRAIKDQQLVLDQHGFGHHRAGAAGTGESGYGRQQMQKPDGQVAHRWILPRS